MRYVSTLQYARLLEAAEYYEEKGFKYVDVPWAVSRKAILLTRPPQIKTAPFSFAVDYERSDKWLTARPGTRLYPVASAEQSFLQMQMDAVKAGKPITGNYCAITPCFRNEPKLDDLHQPYFMKLELISWVPIDGNPTEQEIALHRMIAHARQFFEELEKDFETETVLNAELAQGDPLCVGGHAFDIQSFRCGIEIGSYGIRQHKAVGRWLYGTGLAEPRYTYAVEVEAAQRAAAGQIA